MKKLFAILLTISVLGANAQNVKTKNSLQNPKSTQESNKKSWDYSSWVYQIQSINSATYGPSLKYRDNYSSLSDFNNSFELYPKLSRYYYDVPKSIFEAINYTPTDIENETAEVKINYYDTGVKNVHFGSEPSAITTNILNIGRYKPVWSWFGYTQTLSIRRQKGEFGYNMKIQGFDFIKIADIQFQSSTSSINYSFIPLLQTPYIAKRVSVYFQSGLMLGYFFSGRLNEYGAVYDNDGSIEYINNTYVQKGGLLNFNVIFGTGVNIKLNPSTTLFAGIDNHVTLGVTHELSSESSFDFNVGVKFNFKK